MASIEELEKAINDAQTEISQLQENSKGQQKTINDYGHSAFELAESTKKTLAKFFHEKLFEHASDADHTYQKYPPYFSSHWNQQDWKNYSHEIHAPVNFITIGELKEDISDSQFRVPVFLPFIGENKTVVISFTPEDKQNKLEIFQGLIERAALMLPHACSFCLLDPEGLNASFPIQKSLPSVRQADLEISRTLRDILEDISRINQDYLTREVDSFEKLPDQIRSNERFEFIFVANFPKDYDRRSIEYLQKICKAGPKAGKYVFIHYDTTAELPAELNFDSIENTYMVRETDLQNVNWGVPIDFSWAMPAPSDTSAIVFNGLREAKPVEHNLEFSEITSTAPDQWWQGDATREVRVPIGGAGSKHIIDLWFGAAVDNRQCSHGMLGAMPGSGKSNLYHVFICGLASRYSPEEVNLYLIDGKQGVEFQAYKDLPHAKVVALHTTPRLARSVVEELVHMMERRNELFQEFGVVDLTAYRALGSPKGKLPRLMLIVDEFQTLFDADKEGYGSKLMLELASQGRSAGIHMFVGSQRFGAPNMLNQAAIFGNVHLRVAMKMSDGDIAALTEFGKSGKARIRGCDVAGKIVVNDAAGDDDANQPGKVAYLDDESKKVFIDKIIQEYQKRFPDNKDVGAVLFNGTEQPLMTENPQLKKLFALYSNRPSNTQWQEYAQSPEFDSGLGETEWYSGECPTVFWLGQDFNIHGQTKIILRRRREENIMIAGEYTEARLGLLASILTSFSINHATTSNTKAEIHIFDRSVIGSPWHGVLQTLVESYLEPTGASANFASDPAEFENRLSTLCATLEKRKELPESDLIELPPIYLLLFEAQRMPGLEKITSRHGMKQPSELGEQLILILSKGPELGIHTILSYSSVRAMQHIFDSNELKNFRHNVALQMTEDESFNFLRSREAASLQEESKKPILAFYSNAPSGIAVKFKPYCYFEQSQKAFYDDIATAYRMLEAW